MAPSHLTDYYFSYCIEHCCHVGLLVVYVPVSILDLITEFIVVVESCLCFPIYEETILFEPFIVGFIFQPPRQLLLLHIAAVFPPSFSFLINFLKFLILAAFYIYMMFN